MSESVHIASLAGDGRFFGCTRPEGRPRADNPTAVLFAEYLG